MPKRSPTPSFHHAETAGAPVPYRLAPVAYRRVPVPYRRVPVAHRCTLVPYRLAPVPYRRNRTAMPHPCSDGAPVSHCHNGAPRYYRAPKPHSCPDTAPQCHPNTTPNATSRYCIPIATSRCCTPMPLSYAPMPHPNSMPRCHAYSRNQPLIRNDAIHATLYCGRPK